jgi:hypothetical protein
MYQYKQRRGFYKRSAYNPTLQLIPVDECILLPDRSVIFFQKDVNVRQTHQTDNSGAGVIYQIYYDGHIHSGTVRMLECIEPTAPCTRQKQVKFVTNISKRTRDPQNTFLLIFICKQSCQLLYIGENDHID